MKTKVCTKCKKEFELNTTNFFKKKDRYKLKSGEYKVFYKFSCWCKDCHKKNTAERQIKKRCEYYGCDRKDYKEAYERYKAYQLLKYKELDGIEKNLRAMIIRFIDNKGYKFTTVENFFKDRKKTTSESYRLQGLKRRKYEYGHRNKISSQNTNEMAMLYIADSRIAQSMGVSVKDIPKEVIEIQRNIIKIKRALGNTHSSIHERNINNKYQEQWKLKEN